MGPPCVSRAPVVHGDRAVADGVAETSSSRRVLGSPPWYRVGPWPAIRGWTRNLYSSIRSSRSSSVASLPLPRSTPAGVASLRFCTPARRSPAMWWLLVHGKSVRVDDTTYFGLASSLTAHSRRPAAPPRRRGRPPASALHHLVGDATPQHRPALVHEAGEEGVCLVVGDPLLVVDAAVQGDVDAEGQESHAASLRNPIARGCPGACAGRRDVPGPFRRPSRRPRPRR